MNTKMTVAAISGLIVGVVATWLLVARTAGRVVANQYIVAVMDQANVALHIRANRQMELLTNIEAALPSYALAVSQQFNGDPGSTNALWMVKAYYLRTQIAIPAQIRNIMDSLPPKPPTACEIRLRALDGASPHPVDNSGTR